MCESEHERKCECNCGCYECDRKKKYNWKQYLSFFTEEDGYVKCKEYESYDDCKEEIKFMLDSAIFSPQYYNYHIVLKDNNWRETGKTDTWVLKYY